MSVAEVRAPAAPERADPLSLVTDEIVEKFWRDGAVWIEGLLSPAWLRLIDKGVERNLRNPGPNLIRHYEGEPGEYLDDYGNYFANPEYQRLLADSPIPAVVAKVLKTPKLWLFLDQIFVKEGGYSRRTPWHQDMPWLMADGEVFLTVWVALQPLSADETLEFVAGSHRGPLYDHGVDGVGIDRTVQSASKVKLPDIEAEREKFPIISHASQPGDILLFHPATLHGGGAMREGGKRRSLNMRFYGDGTRYVDREEGHDPEFPGVSETHRHGDPLRHGWFPQVFPRAV
jgi:hypothetical protein